MWGRELLLAIFIGELAEREGFEPSEPCGSPDFESGTFDHSATSPVVSVQRAAVRDRCFGGSVPSRAFYLRWRGFLPSARPRRPSTAATLQAR